MEQIYTPKQDYKVLCLTITYNQSEYIQSTLDGFAMQSTNFPFVGFVIDDCSTDGEQKVIRAWLKNNCDMLNAEYIDIPTAEVVIARHRDNPYLTMAIYLLKKNMYCNPAKRDHWLPWLNRSTYIAECEGDDYWTDSCKLQKQVDFLDNHSDYTMCIHRVQTKAEGNRVQRDIFGFLQTREYTADDIFSRWTCPTCSMVYRTDVLKYRPENKNFTYGDSVLVLTCLSHGKIYCFGESMGVYRLNDGGWTAKPKLEQFRLHTKHHKGLYESFPICKHPQFEQNIRRCMILLMIELKYNHLDEEFATQHKEYFEYFKDDSKLKLWLQIHKGVLKNIIKKIIGKK